MLHCSSNVFKITVESKRIHHTYDQLPITNYAVDNPTQAQDISQAIDTKVGAAMTSNTTRAHANMLADVQGSMINQNAGLTFVEV